MAKANMKAKKEAEAIAQKYDENAHLTGEGHLNLGRQRNGRSLYGYFRAHGISISDGHQKIVAKVKDLKGLEEFLQDRACDEPAPKKPKATPAPKEAPKITNLISTCKSEEFGCEPKWKNDTNPPTERQRKLANSQTIVNYDDFGRRQLYYIIGITDEAGAERANKKHKDSHYAANKLFRMGVEFAQPTTSKKSEKTYTKAEVDAMVAKATESKVKNLIKNLFSGNN